INPSLRTLYRYFNLVKVRRLRTPQCRIFKFAAECQRRFCRTRCRKLQTQRISAEVRDPRHDFMPASDVYSIDVHAETSIRSCVYCNPINEYPGDNLKINRSINASQLPVVTIPFRTIHGALSRRLTDCDFEQVSTVESYQPGNIIPETIESALMDRAGRPSINTPICVSHHPFENNEYRFPLPRVIRCKGIAV